MPTCPPQRMLRYQTHDPKEVSGHARANDRSCQSEGAEFGETSHRAVARGHHRLGFAVVLLAGGGWALWKDRVDRDASGFVSIGTASLRTDTYAIVGDLHGDGPSWLWESGVLGDSRVRATSDVKEPLFIGIALRRPLPLSRRRRLRDDRQLRGHGRHHPCGWTTVGSALTGVDLGDIHPR